MTMKFEKIDGAIWRTAITGAVTSDKFLAAIRGNYDPKAITVGAYRSIIVWCSEYFDKYGHAPLRDMAGILEEKQATTDEVMVARIRLALSKITTEDIERGVAGKFNWRFAKDKFISKVKQVSLAKLAKDIERMATKDPEAAEDLLEQYKKESVGEDFGSVDLLSSPEVFREAFEEETEPLFSFPGDVGNLINHLFTRGCFISLMAPEKRGKTFTLMDISIQALKARCNVAVFACGDMNREQMVQRYSSRLSNRPIRPSEFYLPILDCKLNQQGECKCEGGKGNQAIEFPDEIYPEDMLRRYPNHSPCSRCRGKKKWQGAVWWEKKTYSTGLNWREAWKAAKKFRGYLAGKSLRMYNSPADTLSVSGLNAVLDRWFHEDGFVADVIVIDYADIMAGDPTIKELRHQENKKWMGLRALADKRKALVVSATQSDVKGHDAVTITSKNFSEDKRKLAHPQAIIGLNQTPEEKEMGVVRLNFVVSRSSRQTSLSAARQVKVLTCFPLARAFVDSYV